MISWSGLRWTASASASIIETAFKAISVPASTSWTAPMLPIRKASGALSLATLNVLAVEGLTIPARWLPTPMGTLKEAAASARLALIFSASWVPPVIDSIMKGWLNFLPRKTVSVEMSSGSCVGAA
jgi:hypothetical protein